MPDQSELSLIMNILNGLLSLMFAILTGLTLIFCITLMACMLLFSARITIAIGKTKMITTFEQVVPSKEFRRPIITSEPTQLIIEFDEAELLAKLAKEIAPTYSMILQIAVKNQTWAVISLTVQSNSSTWNMDLHLQNKPPEIKDHEERRLVFSCKQLSENCTLTKYEFQKEPVVQSLDFDDVVGVLLQAVHSPYQAPFTQNASSTHTNVKTEEGEVYQSSKE